MSLLVEYLIRKNAVKELKKFAGYCTSLYYRDTNKSRKSVSETGKKEIATSKDLMNTGAR